MIKITSKLSILLIFLSVLVLVSPVSAEINKSHNLSYNLSLFNPLSYNNSENISANGSVNSCSVKTVYNYENLDCTCNISFIGSSNYELQNTNQIIFPPNFNKGKLVFVCGNQTFNKTYFNSSERENSPLILNQDDMSFYDRNHNLNVSYENLTQTQESGLIKWKGVLAVENKNNKVMRGCINIVGLGRNFTISSFYNSSKILLFMNKSGSQKCLNVELISNKSEYFNVSFTTELSINSTSFNPLIWQVVPVDAINKTAPPEFYTTGDAKFDLYQNSNFLYSNISLPKLADKVVVSQVFFDKFLNQSVEILLDKSQYTVKNFSVEIKRVIPKVHYLIRETPSFKTIKCEKNLSFNRPISWSCLVSLRNRTYNITYSTPPIFLNWNFYNNSCGWYENVSLKTKSLRPYENLEVPLILNKSNFIVKPPLTWYSELGTNTLIFKIPVLNKRFEFMLLNGCLSNLSPPTYKNVSITSVLNLTLTGSPPTERNQNRTKEANETRVNELANLSLINPLFLFNLSSINLTLPNNTISSLNITTKNISRGIIKKGFAPNVTLSTKFGGVVIKALNSSINRTSAKWVNGRLFLKIKTLNNKSSSKIVIVLPKGMPKNVETYIWQKVGKTYMRVPYTLRNNSKIEFSASNPNFNAQNNIIDLNGSIKVVIPNFNVSVNKKLRGASIKIKSSSEERRASINLSSGDLASVKVVDPKDTINTPHYSFKYKLLKFTVSNIKKGGSVNVTLSLDHPITHPKIIKFNPNTGEWYSYPFKVVNPTTLRITLTDGKLGDDDLLKNGQIEDDLGITDNWWNTSWKWRSAYNISNVAGNLTNYQFELKLNSSNFNFSKADNDGSDLRFVYYNSSSDTEMEMSYWLKEYNSSSENADVWFKVPFLENNTNTTIFVYYGNPSAVSESNGSDVFIFFSNGSSLTGWTNNGATVNSSNGVPAPSLEATGGTYAYVDAGVGPGEVIEYDGYVIPGSTDLCNLYFMTDSGGAGQMFRLESRSSTSSGFASTSSWTSWNAPSGYGPVSAGVWHHVKIVLDGSTAYGYVDGSSYGSYSFSNNGGYIAVHGDASSVTGGDFDNVIIRKYANPAPALSTYIGSEYNGILNISMDLPLNNSNHVRTQSFVMNGTVKCVRGNCGNVSTWYQFYYLYSPLQSWTESTTEDFETYYENNQVSYGNNQLTLLSLNTPSWWNNQWSYRENFSLYNNNGNLTNYQVKLLLNNSVVGSDFNWTTDENAIRFVYYNSTSGTNNELSYWIQSWNSSSKNATIWIKVPFLENNTNTTIFVYYGNLDAVSESDAQSTFIFYSSGNSLNGWTSSGATVKSDNGNPSPSLEATGGTYAYIDANAGSDEVIEYDGYVIPGSTDLCNFYFMTDSGGAGQMFRLESRSSTSSGFASTSSWTSWNAPSGYGPVSAGVWHHVKIVLDGSTAYGYVDGSSYGSYSFSNNGGYIAVHGDGSSVTGGDFDNIIVRKYAPNNIIIYNGSEEGKNYSSSGVYVSKMFDSGTANVNYINITWDALTNSNTSIKVYTRTSTGDIKTWWNQDWQYRKKINLSYSGTPVQNAQIRLTINTTELYNEGKIRSDCGDIRFVIWNSTAQGFSTLPYWQEGACNTTGGNTTFWIKVPELNSSIMIEMYYDNADAGSVSDGSAVFDFFDDFAEGLDTNVWSATSSSDTSVSNGVLRINAGSVYTDSTLGNSPQNYTFDIKAQFYTLDSSYSGLMIADAQSTKGSNSGSNALSYLMTNSGSGSDLQMWGADGTASSYNLVSGDNLYTSLQTDTPYIFGFSFSGNSQLKYFIDNPDYTNIASQAYSGTWNSPYYLWLGYFTGSTSGTTAVDNIGIDWVRVRKFLQSQPTETVLSEEDLSSQSTDPSNFVWSPWYLETNSSEPNSPDRRYMQYKVVMNTSNSYQTPILNLIQIRYKVSSTGWRNMKSSGTIFEADNPYNCGILDQSNKYCYPNINVLPTQAGEFLLRMCSNSTDHNVVQKCTNNISVSVWIQPQMSSFTSSRDPVGKGQNTTLKVRLLSDDGTTPLKGYNLTFTDMTGDGSLPYSVGWALTDSQGYATVNYVIPNNAYLGYHTLNASYSGNTSRYILPVNLTKTILVSSVPKINNITVTPQTVGFGYNVTITANVTDEKGLDAVLINITNSSGYTNTYSMNHVSGDTYKYVFTDTWHVDSYTFNIFANNTDGVYNTSPLNNFYVKVFAEMITKTQKVNYKNNEEVYLNGTRAGSQYSAWLYRKQINMSSAPNDLTDYQVKLLLTGNEIDFNKLNSDGSDLRFTYYNETSQEEQAIPYWIESFNYSGERAVIWVKVPEITTSNPGAILYMYFGNSNAESVSNGSAVFDFFDDFNESSLDTNVWYVNSGNYVLSNGVLRLNTGAVGLQGALSFNLEDGYAVDARILFDGTSSGYSGTIPELSSSRFTAGGNGNSDATVLYMRSGGSQGVNYWIGDGSTNSYNVGSGSTGWTSEDYVWYDTGVSVDGGTLKLWKDNQAIKTFSNINWAKQFNYFSLGYFDGADSDGQDTSYDWVFIRKYRDNFNPTEELGETQANSNGLVNLGNTNFKGYLRMLVQRWTGSEWQNILPPVLDSTLYNVNDWINLSKEWTDAGAWGTSNNQPGWYRVYSVFEDPNHNVLVDSEGRRLEYAYNFSIIKPTLILTNLTYENENDHGIKEYETGDTINWINVTVEPLNNTAYNVNATLNLFDSSLQQTQWGPQNETKYCGNLSENQECERQWNNNTNGYFIPFDASSGTYDFYWDVIMQTSNGDEKTNHSNAIIIHNIPSTFSESVDKTRIYKPDWTYYNFTFTNSWSKNLTNAVIKINCPSINGLKCYCINSGTDTCDLGSIANGSTTKVSFNVSANTSVPSNDYTVNITLNYTNPGGEYKSWKGYAPQVIEVRTKGILEIHPEIYPENATRNYDYSLDSYINNTGDDAANDVWLNYTLPSNWRVSSGVKDKSQSSLDSSAIMWNNITVHLNQTASVGQQEIRIDSGASDGRNDWKILYINVFANTTLSLISNQSLANRGDNVTLTTALKYDNGTAISGENISFYDQTASKYIGWAITDSQGLASVNYQIPADASLGYHTFNATFNGDSGKFAWGSQNTTIVDVHMRPSITDVQATPNITGYGQNIHIEASVTDDDTVDKVILRLTYPNGMEENYTMNLVPPNTYYYNFNNTWQLGSYNFTLWANDTTSSSSESNITNFTISVESNTNLATLKDDYNANEYVNITEPKAEWWNSSWPFRKNISVFNSAGDLTNYQVKLNINMSDAYKNNQINDNCSNIKFTYYNASSDSEYEIPYWIQNCSVNTTGSLMVWVRVPYLKNNINTTIYAYFGNSNAESVSNGSAVFEFFDDFNENNLDSNVWSVSSSDYSLNNSVLRLNTGAVGLQGALSFNLEDGYAVDARILFDGTSSGYSGTIPELSSSRFTAGGNGNSDATVLYMRSGGSQGVNYWIGDGSTNSYNVGSGSTGWTSEDYVWYDTGVSVDGGTLKLWEDNQAIKTFSNINWAKPLNYFSLGYFAGGDSDIQDTSYDWVFVRKYREPQPQVYIGNKEHVGSSISNFGSTNFSGYLMMKVQYNNSGVWQDVDTIVNDLNSGNERTINSSGLNLASIWNPNSWYTSNNNPGKYRVLSEFVDPEGNVLKNLDGTNISAHYPFIILEPALLLNITNISIYDVTDASEANWHYYTNDFVDSGLNKTFNLFKDHIYRVEVDVEDVGESDWNISLTNITYLGFNSTWNVNEGADIFYSNATTIGDRRTDTTKEGGLYNGTVKWNTTQFDGIVKGNNKATFFFIINLTSTGDLPVNFKVIHKDFVKKDYSEWHVIQLDTTPPGLYNNTYNLTNDSIIRGDPTEAYARWDETIAQSNITYTTTSSSTWYETTNTSPQNSGNWTNFTISTTSSWFLGEHDVQIKAKDESGNWNDTLPYLKLYLFGEAEVTDSNLNSSNINVGDTVSFSCKVTDGTDSESPIADYVVNFYNSTGLIGTSTTNSTGWATVNYTDESPGTETLTCNITSNITRFYKTNSNNYATQQLTTQETTPPYYTTINGPSSAHKGDSINLNVYWHDNFALNNATLSVNSTGSWSNESSISLSGVDDWANFSYQIPTSINPGTLEWKQYGYDDYNNYNITPTQTIDVWGWSSVGSASVSPASIQETNSTTMHCQIIDANSSTALSNYQVYFWIKNSTESSYEYLGSNTTDSSGLANYTFVVNTADTYTVMCNITDDSTLKYNDSSSNSGTATLNVVSGQDTTPPYIVGNNYTINDTDIMRGECVKISGLWSESINESWATYDVTLGNLNDYILPTPYTGNWTNYTACTNNSWEPGNHSIKLKAKDQAGNLNDSLPYKNFIMWGRSQVQWISPTGDQDRKALNLTCRVIDHDTGEGIGNYQVTFYDGDLGYSIGTSTTNSTGYAMITYNFSNHNVGPDQLSCAISDDNSKYYKVYGSSTVYQTINLYGYLTPNITNPSNNSIIHRGTGQALNSTVKDEFGNPPKDENGNDATITATWYNLSEEQVASGENTIWSIPSNYPLGDNNLILNESADYYYEGTSSINVQVYGYSNVTWVSPDGGNYTDATLNLTCLVRDTATGSPINNYPVEFFNGTTSLGFVNTNSTGYAVKQITTSSLGNGEHTLKCVIYNNSTLYYNRTTPYEGSTQVVVDTVPPEIYFNPNSDASGSYNRNWTFINVTASDTNKNVVLLYWNGTPESFGSNSGDIYWTNKTGLPDGTYTFYAWVNDTAGNTNQTETRTITIDTTPPTLTIISPENKGYSTSSVWFNVSSDEVASSCWYYLDSDSTKYDLTELNNTYYYKSVSVSDGYHNLTFFCNDSVDNVGNASINFTVDTTPPTVALNQPVDNYNSSSSQVTFNCTASDNLHLVNVTLYSNFGGTWTANGTNSTPINGGQTIFTRTLSDGTYTWNCRACDDAQCSFAPQNFTLTIDTQVPTVTIQSPENRSYPTTSIDLNYTANDIHLDSCWYNLDGGSNISLPNCNNTTLSGLSEGNHIITVYANDTAGNIGSSNQTFTVDTTNPSLTVQSPINKTTYENDNNIQLNYTVGDNMAVDSCWYVLDGQSSQNLPNCDNTTLSGLSNSNHTLTVYVNDTAGNMNSSSLWFVVNVTALVVTPESPANNSYINKNWVWANATTNKEGYNCTYSLDGGANQTMTNDSTLHWWANATSLSDGQHNVLYYCDDASGNVSKSDQVYFTIDTVNPSLTVQSPINNKKYASNSIDLNYTASDENSISCYYSLDGNSYTELTSCENTTLTGILDGNHNVSVKVVDEAGNINETTINFSVDTTPPTLMIISPESKTYTNSNVWFNVSSDEIVSSCWYYLDSDSTKYILTELNNTYYYTSVNSEDGNHNVTFYCNDTVNNIGSADINFTVDTTGPSITFVSPTPNDGGAIAVNWTFINITTSDLTGTDSAILEWHNSTGAYNYTMTKSGADNFYYNMTGLPDATYYYKVYSNDTLGNNASSNLRSVIVSTKAPIIYVDSPISTTYNHNIIDLNVSSNKEIIKWWFTLNGRNFSFEPNTTITSDIGSNTLTVYGEDNTGKVGNTTVTFSTNLTEWDDNFKGFTGILYHQNITINKNEGNASIGLCWPAVSKEYEDENPDCWPYRKALNISSSTDLTNYQFKLNINLTTLKNNGKVRDDCADLRFTYLNSSDEEQKIPYWVENCGNSTTNSTVWIKVPSITTTGSIIYMYYGSNVSTSKSNASSVFEFFDNFTNVDSSIWGSNAQNWESSNGIAYPTESGTNSQLTATYTFLNSYATELRFRGNSSSGASGYYRLGDGSGTKNLILYLEPPNNRINLYNGANNYYTMNCSQQHTYTIISDYTDNSYKLYVDNDGTPALSLTSASSGSNVHPVFYSYYVNGLYLDWIAIRKYSQNEPMLNSISTEQRNIQNATLNSILISPSPLWNWDKFYANTNIPTGTNISFQIKNDNNITLCNITSAEASSGYNICDAAQNYSKLYLTAFLSTTTAGETPYLINWNITWEPKANISFEVLDSSGSTRPNAKIEVYNSTGNTLASGSGSTYANLEINRGYTIKSITPAPVDNLTATINNMNITSNSTIEERVITSYSGNLPSLVSNITPIFAFNNPGYNFTNAKLIIPKNGVNIDYILHCTNWNYATSNCTSWEVNSTSDYASFGENDTYFWFNTTTFDAYAGGSSSKDLSIKNITFNMTSPKEGENITITVNVTNSGGAAINSFNVQLNRSMWNGTNWVFQSSETKTASISGNSYSLVNFSWIAKPGTYNFTAYVDPDNSISESNETNNEYSTNYTVPEWEIFYGQTNTTIVLADSNNKNFTFWMPAVSSGYMFFADSDAQVNFTALKPLNGTNDLKEADEALNITGFNDSIENLWDKNHDGHPDEFMNITIRGREIDNVPVVNSTNSSNFKTGLLWDSSTGDSSTEYDGTQTLIVMTKIQNDLQGKYGTYDYEVRVPSALKNQVGTTPEISIYLQLA